MKRILQIMMILKGLKVGVICYMGGESSVKMTSNKERDLFWWLEMKDQLKLL